MQVQVGPFTKPDVVPLVAGNAVPLEQLENLVDQGQFRAKVLSCSRGSIAN